MIAKRLADEMKGVGFEEVWTDRIGNVIGRIQAAHELAKSGKRANIQAVVDAYAAEVGK